MKGFHRTGAHHCYRQDRYLWIYIAKQSLSHSLWKKECKKGLVPLFTPVNFHWKATLLVFSKHSCTHQCCHYHRHCQHFLHWCHHWHPHHAWTKHTNRFCLISLLPSGASLPTQCSLKLDKIQFQLKFRCHLADLCVNLVNFCNFFNKLYNCVQLNVGDAGAAKHLD